MEESVRQIARITSINSKVSISTHQRMKHALGIRVYRKSKPKEGSITINQESHILDSNNQETIVNDEQRIEYEEKGAEDVK